jgi:hypothetical protein
LSDGPFVFVVRPPAFCFVCFQTNLLPRLPTTHPTKTHGLPLNEAKMTVLTVAEDAAMPMCSIGNAEKIVLERGQEVTVQVQQFNPMQD